MTSVTHQHQEEMDPRMIRTRELAVEAAVEIIAEEGLDSCTMQNVSRRTRIARSTLYRHWPEPQDLHVEALEAIARPPDADGPDTGSLTGDLIDLAEGLARALTQTEWGQLAPQLFAGAAVSEDIAAVLQRFIDARMGVAADVFERARSRGQLSADCSNDDLVALLMGPIYYRYLIARQSIDEDWIGVHVDRVRRFVSTESVSGDTSAGRRP